MGLKWTRLMLAVALVAGASSAAAEEFWIGVGTHFAQGRGDPTLAAVGAAGVKSFRDEFYWSHVEVTKGVLQVPPEFDRMVQALARARDAGIEPVVILDYGNGHYGGGLAVSDEARAGFVRYVEFVVSTLKGKVRFYEVWNEWNIGLAGSGPRGRRRDPQAYVQLLKATYPAIKRLDRAAIVLGGAVAAAGDTSWIEGMLKEGAADYMDGLSIHPYMHFKRSQGTPENLLRVLEHLQARVSDTMPARQIPVYITELGWPTSIGGLGIPEDRCAAYLARSYLLVRTVRAVRGLWWYELSDYGSDPNREGETFGLLKVDGQPKPAYFAMRDIAALFAQTVSVTVVSMAKDVWVVQLSLTEGDEAIAVWTPDGLTRRMSVEVEASSAGSLSVQRMGASTRSAVPMVVKAGKVPISVVLDGMPTLISSPEVSVKFIQADNE